MMYVIIMEPAKPIITRLGGIRKTARLLGHRNHTTVQGWWERDRIPDDHVPIIQQVDRAEGAAA